MRYDPHPHPGFLSSFITIFQVTKLGSSGIRYFSMMNVHLRPDVAYQELLDMRHVIHDLFLTILNILLTHRHH